MPSNLFSAGQIGTMTLPNRVIRSATQDPFGHRDGTCAPEQVALYRDIAAAGTGAIIVTTLAISLIVTILNMYEGFRATDAQKIRLMAAMGASRWQLLWMLVFPANYATLLNTLKVNVGLSWVGVIMGEFLVSRAGLGYLIVYGSQVFNMDLVMTSVLLLLVAAVVMYRLVLWVEKLLYRVWGLKA